MRRGGGWRRGTVEIFRPTGAPVLDPTCERLGVKFPGPTRQLHRKDKALAETAALLVLSKKLQAIFHEGEDA